MPANDERTQWVVKHFIQRGSTVGGTHVVLNLQKIQSIVYNTIEPSNI